jgi:hypothetical protein
MQLIEVSMTGVRSAVITLQRESTPLRFVLFPMIHLGTAAFYQDVTARLRDCQLIVAEGVKGPSIIGLALMLSYRLPGRSRRLNLAVQDIDYPGLARQAASPGARRAGHSGPSASDMSHTGSGSTLICPDMTARQFGRLWRSVPAVQRIAIWLVIPVMAVVIRLVGTRRYLARHMEQTDLPTIEDIAVRDKFPKVAELLFDRRDALILRALAAIHEQHSSEPVTVAVVYGAAHMPAVVHGLRERYGYRPRSAEWVTVFDF